MTDKTNTPPEEKKPETVESAGGRRRFVRGAGVAVPVVLSVWSANARSTLATTCLSPSASASINLLHSRPDRKQDPCTGRTPGFWYNCPKTHPSTWAAAGGEGLLFSSIYAGGFPGLTMTQVMGLNGNGDPYQLGAHLAAAYFNWKMGWVPNSVLSLADLQAMWAGRFGTYTPTPGVTWGAQQIVDYLKTTMPL